MKKISAIALCCLLSLRCLAQSPAANEIPFTLLPSGHILVKAAVDGVEGSFIFDTGAGLTAFTKKFFDKLPHKQKEDGGYTGFRATGERMDLDLYLVNDVRFGALQKAREEVSFIDAELGGIDGILSLKLVEHTPFTIDFDRLVIRLENAQQLAALRKKAARIALQPEQSRGKALGLFAYFRVNDTLHLQLSLDAGAGKEVYRLNAKYMDLLGIDKSDTLQVKKFEKRSELNAGFSSAIYATKLSRLHASDQPSVKTEHFPVQFVEGLIYDGIIWINWLGRQLTFDIDNQALWVR